MLDNTLEQQDALAEILNRDPEGALMRVLLQIARVHEQSGAGEQFQELLRVLRRWVHRSVSYHELRQAMACFINEGFRRVDDNYPCAKEVTAQTLTGLVDISPEMWMRVMFDCIEVTGIQREFPRHMPKVLRWLNQTYAGGFDMQSEMLYRALHAHGVQEREFMPAYQELLYELEASLLEADPQRWRVHHQHKELWCQAHCDELEYHKRLNRWVVWLRVVYPERVVHLQPFASNGGE